MGKSKKKKFAKPDMYETMKRLNKELEKVSWLHLYNPTERFNWMGLPKEKRSLHLLNDPLYPIPRKLLAYENESEKWNDVFQEAIIDRLHEMILTAFSNRAYPYQEIILSPGEWEYSPMYQKLDGMVIFKLSQRCNFGEVAPRGTIRVNLVLPKISASYTPTFHPIQMANAISDLKKGCSDLFPGNSNLIRIEKKLTAPYGEKGLSEISPPFHVDDDNQSTGRLHYAQKGTNDLYSYGVTMNDTKDVLSKKIRCYLNKILPACSVLKDLDFETYAYDNPSIFLPINGKQYFLPDLARKCITNFRQPKYSDIALDMIGRVWENHLDNCLGSEADRTPEIDIKWDRLDMMQYGQILDSDDHSQYTTIIMTAFIKCNEECAFKLRVIYAMALDPHLIRIEIDWGNADFITAPELDLLRLKNLFIEHLIEDHSESYNSAILMPGDQLFCYIERALQAKWSDYFKSNVRTILAKITIDDGENPSSRKLALIQRGEYPISNFHQIWGLSLTIHRKSGIIDLVDISDIGL